METIIQDASKGSPILAYGSAASSPKQKAIKIAAAVVLLIMVPVLITVAIFFFGSGQFPSSTLLSVSFLPSHLNQKINGALVKELPAPWRAAIETDTSFPVILGLANTEKGEPATYAVIPRTVSISAPEGTSIVKSGLFKTIVSASLKTKKVPYRSFAGVLNARKRGDAGWMVDSRLLRMIAGDRSGDNASADIYGSISGSRGSIFLPPQEIKGENESGSFFVLLGKSSEQYSIVSESLLSQGISIRDLKDPEAVFLKGDGELNARWTDLNADEQVLIAVAQGGATGTAFDLPDKDVVRQISPLPESASGTANNLLISSAWEQSSGQADMWRSSCPGEVQLALHGEALQNLLILFHVPPAWREKIQSLAITSNQGKSGFCVNE